VVGRGLTRNAVTLNSTTVNVARVVGPTIAAVLISTIGIGWCFIVNAVSFGFVILSLLSLDPARLHPVPPVHRHRGQLRAGVRYAAHVPAIARPPLMMAIVGTFTFEFEVSLPLLARTTFHGGRTTYSWLLAGLGAGAVASGLYAARHARTVLTGAASIAFLTTGNSTIQLTSEPDYRGRVTALWSIRTA
jgi:Transmembrane secretion effector